MKLKIIADTLTAKRKYHLTDMPDILKGKVRYFDENSGKGMIIGPKNIMFDIALNPFDKKHQEWGKMIKEKMPIKFKVVDDPDYDMAIIGPFSFK